MTQREIDILTRRLIPVPQQITFGDGAEFSLTDNCSIRLETGEVTGLLPFRKMAKEFWAATPEFEVKENPALRKFGPDDYKIRITSDQLAVSARGTTGVMNAFKTLRQLAEVRRGTDELSHFLVPCAIDDKPAMEFRGIHLCIFPETPLWDIEKAIRLAAYHKFNYAVIESWGVFPFESHPEFCWADRKISRTELKKLVSLGRELGITLIPQFNLLGHASMARGITGKHAVLDCHPECQQYFEPEGWCWCLSNPKTRSLLTDLVLELDDFYGRPPFFHIGCDEADNLGACRDCRKQPLADLVYDHILYFHDLLKKRGARVIMWHDMLLNREDPRWTGYTACGLPEQKLDRLYEKLPRDIVIADWQYNYEVKEEDPEPVWPTMKFFKNEKFAALGCPWINERGINSIGRFAAREKLFGMLETTWHTWHGRFHAIVFGTAANAAWNPSVSLMPSFATRLAVAHHLRQTGWDMKVDGYEQTGWNLTQVDISAF